MNRYRLLSGLHADGKQVYEPGDIVESGIDLTSRFANKFERVYPTDPVAPVSAQESPSGEETIDPSGVIAPDGSDAGEEIIPDASEKSAQAKQPLRRGR